MYHTVEHDIEEPSQETVARILETPKNNKSPSENKNKTAELLKKGGKNLLNIFHKDIREV